MEEYAILKIALGVMIVTEIVKFMFFQDEILKNRFVPAIAIALGVFFNMWDQGFKFNYDIFLGGIASGFAGIGAYSTIKSGAKSMVKQVKDDITEKVYGEEGEG